MAKIKTIISESGVAVRYIQVGSEKYPTRYYDKEEYMRAMEEDAKLRKERLGDKSPTIKDFKLYRDRFDYDENGVKLLDKIWVDLDNFSFYC
jgi:hypothetical protein